MCSLRELRGVDGKGWRASALGVGGVREGGGGGFRVHPMAISGGGERAVVRAGRRRLRRGGAVRVSRLRLAHRGRDNASGAPPCLLRAAQRKNSESGVGGRAGAAPSAPPAAPEPRSRTGGARQRTLRPARPAAAPPTPPPCRPPPDPAAAESAGSTAASRARPRPSASAMHTRLWGRWLRALPRPRHRGTAWQSHCCSRKRRVARGVPPPA